jgi:hypothetical protein
MVACWSNVYVDAGSVPVLPHLQQPAALPHRRLSRQVPGVLDLPLVASADFVAPPAGARKTCEGRRKQKTADEVRDDSAVVKLCDIKFLATPGE